MSRPAQARGRASLVGIAALISVVAACSAPATPNDDPYATWATTRAQVDALLGSGDLSAEIVELAEDSSAGADEFGAPLEIYAFTPDFVAGDGSADPPLEPTGTWYVPVLDSAGNGTSVALITGDPDAPGARAILSGVSWDPELARDPAALPAGVTLVEYQPKGALFTYDDETRTLTAVRYRWGAQEWTLEDWAAELERDPGGGAA